jgi:predicted extracellular nuclease
MGAGFEATEPRRVQQAQWNLDIVQEIQAREPDARIAILGDLNTFPDTPSINLLREGGLLHVFEQLPPEERYTYIFQGESETLDHILVTPALAKLINAVYVLHINADFPPSTPDDESPQRTSDHDPVVVWFGKTVEQ